MEHKALKYQMKTMISNFPDEILRPILAQLEIIFKSNISISIILKSYKCFEASLTFKDKKITGYGRSEIEAFRICLKNFLEFLTENESYIEFLKTALSNVKNFEEINLEKKSKTKNLEINTVNFSPLGNKMLNHTKEFGNISSINMIETPQNLYNSIMENDCLLVKMLNEHPDSKIKESNDIIKTKNTRINLENDFRKQKVEKNYCSCNHEEMLLKALKEINSLNNEINSLKNENEVLRVFICNKENDDVEKKKEKKCKNNGNKKDEVDYLQKIYNPSSNSLKDDEKNFISKLQMNLGLGTDKYKIL